MICRLVGAGLGYRQVTLGVALACVAAFGCGSTDSDASDGEGKAGSGLTITIPLPPQVPPVCAAQVGAGEPCDMHVTWLLGAARVLAEHRDR